MGGCGTGVGIGGCGAGMGMGALFGCGYGHARMWDGNRYGGYNFGCEYDRGMSQYRWTPVFQGDMPQFNLACLFQPGMLTWSRWPLVIEVNAQRDSHVLGNQGCGKKCLLQTHRPHPPTGHQNKGPACLEELRGSSQPKGPGALSTDTHLLARDSSVCGLSL